MAITKINQQQLQETLAGEFEDTLTAGTDLQLKEDVLGDLNAIRSQINRALNGTVAGNFWYVDTVAPTAFGDAGTQRGVNDLNLDLHSLQRKRILKRVTMVGVDLPDPGLDQFLILGAVSLPSTTALALGGTTLGTVAAAATSFGTASATDLVAGANALQPKNLLLLIDGTTGKPVTRASDEKQVYGLFQSESAIDGSTLTDITPNRIQISFVVRNATNDGLELVSAGDMAGVSFDYAYVRREAFADCPEEAWLGDGFTDTGITTVTRQSAYDNQGTGAVTTITNSTLDLGAGLLWEIGDAVSAPLFTLTEGSSGGTTTLTVGAGVDVYNNSAVDVNFTNGVTVDNGSNSLNLGVTANQIDFTGNGTVTTSSGSTITLTADAANAVLSTTTSGAVVVSSAGAIDIDGTGVTLDATATSSITMNASAPGSTLTISTTGVPPGGNALSLSSTGNMTLVSNETLDVDSVGNLSINSSGGVINVGNDASTGALNLGTGSASRVITIGNSTGTTALDLNSGTGAISLTSTRDDTVALLDLSQTGTGGGLVSLFVGDSSPNGRVTASLGSLFVDGANGNLWQNLDGSTSWASAITSATTVTRNFFQDTMVTTVSPSGTLTAASFTSGTIATRPSANFTFDTDAEIYLNGVLLLNGTGNDVSQGIAANSIDIGAGGPTFTTGDVVTIVYYTNSTSSASA
jgi:hypothetical protein